MLVGLVVGILIYLILALLGVEYAFLLAIIAGIIETIGVKMPPREVSEDLKQ